MNYFGTRYKILNFYIKRATFYKSDFAKEKKNAFKLYLKGIMIYKKKLNFSYKQF